MGEVSNIEAQQNTYTDGEGYVWERIGNGSWDRQDGARCWFDAVNATVESRTGDQVSWPRGADESAEDTLNRASWYAARARQYRNGR